MFDVVAFDADDTLWHNESNFILTQKKFCKMLPSLDHKVVSQTLSDIHIKNIADFGYGIKGFIFSMMETLIHFKNSEVSGYEIQKVLDYGREMLVSPVELLPNVFEVLEELSKDYYLMLITKGDLIDQERKIILSGLTEFFSGIEIVSDKTVESYKKILSKYKVDASNFLMIGNSMRSDIVPVVQIGALAVHIPYMTTWEHEKDHPRVNSNKFSVLEHIGLLPQYIKGINE